MEKLRNGLPKDESDTQTENPSNKLRLNTDNSVTFLCKDFCII